MNQISIEVQKQNREKNNFSLKYQANDLQGDLALQQITPIKFIFWKYVIFILSNVIIFAPVIIAYWHPQVKRFLYYEFCTLEEATHFYIINHNNEGTIVLKEKKRILINQNISQQYIYFINRYITYIIGEDEVVRMNQYYYFERIKDIMNGTQEKGLNEHQVIELRKIYGIGMRQIQKKSVLFLLGHQLIKPVYIWVILSLAYVYFLAKYYVLGAAFTVILIRGLYLVISKRIKQQNDVIQNNLYQCKINVMRQGQIKQISSLDIVPGDIVFLKSTIRLPFQAIILEGSLVMNEKDLYGDLLYTLKKADFQIQADGVKINEESYIYEGTIIVQVNSNKKMSIFENYRQQYGIPALVIRTNFNTTLAQLARLQVYPKEPKNSFQRQAGNYLIIQLSICACFYITFVILNFKHIGYNIHFLRRFFDLWIMSNPISVIQSMIIGIDYALNRLKQKQMFCIYNHKIIDGGLIDICCFDKSGTLTETQKNLKFIIPSKQNRFEKIISINQKQSHELIERSKKQECLTAIMTNIASNHSLIRLQKNNQLIGDILQYKLVKFGRFNIIKPNYLDAKQVIFHFQRQRCNHYGVVYRQFCNDLKYQRSSSICQHNFHEDYQVFTKGSPQQLFKVMDKTTIPQNYQQVFKEFSAKGYNLLALASKIIPKDVNIHKLSRGQIQNQLKFNGFVILQAMIKENTAQTISQLEKAQIKSIIITRDNPYTASNISYKCNISNKRTSIIICDVNRGKIQFETFDSSNKITQICSIQKDKQFVHHTDRQDRGSSINQLKATQIRKFQSRKTSKIQQSSIQFQDEFSFSYRKKLIQMINNNNCHLCITSQAFNLIFSNALVSLDPEQKYILQAITIISKATPDDKAKIVKALQLLDKKVAMIGDDTHDYKSFKQADVGILFSSAQRTLSAHFTSKKFNISCVIDLIKECRAGIATNLTVLNTMVLFATLQYTSTIISNRFLQFPGDFQFVYWDVCINFIFINFVINTNETADSLTPHKPRVNLLCFTRLLQILSAFAIHFAGHITMIAVYAYIQPQFYGIEGGYENNVNKFYGINQYGFKSGIQSTVIFAIVNNFYLAVIIAFNVSQPWKKHFLTSLPIIIFLLLFITYNLFIIFWENVTYVQFFNSKYIVRYYDRWIIFAVSYSFSAFIIINQKLIMVPLSNYLVKKYPHVKWL